LNLLYNELQYNNPEQKGTKYLGLKK